jgi:hypothetical protein
MLAARPTPGRAAEKTLRIGYILPARAAMSAPPPDTRFDLHTASRTTRLSPSCSETERIDLVLPQADPSNMA